MAKAFAAAIMNSEDINGGEKSELEDEETLYLQPVVTTYYCAILSD